MWSMACMREVPGHELDDGLQPANAAPTPRPAKPYSVIGVSMTRFGRRTPRAVRGSPCRRPGTGRPPRPSGTRSSSRRISSAMASRSASRTAGLLVRHALGQRRIMQTLGGRSSARVARRRPWPSFFAFRSPGARSALPPGVCVLGVGARLRSCASSPSPCQPPLGLGLRLAIGLRLGLRRGLAPSAKPARSVSVDLHALGPRLDHQYSRSRLRRRPRLPSSPCRSRSRR